MEIMTRQEAADFLRLTVQQMDRWAMRSDGPPILKFGHRTVRYVRSDLEAWVQKRAKQSNVHALF